MRDLTTARAIEREDFAAQLEEDNQRKAAAQLPAEAGVELSIGVVLGDDLTERADAIRGVETALKGVYPHVNPSSLAPLCEDSFTTPALLHQTLVCLGPHQIQTFKLARPAHTPAPRSSLPTP